MLREIDDLSKESRGKVFVKVNINELGSITDKEGIHSKNGKKYSTLVGENSNELRKLIKSVE